MHETGKGRLTSLFSILLMIVSFLWSIFFSALSFASRMESMIEKSGTVVVCFERHYCMQNNGLRDFANTRTILT